MQIAVIGAGASGLAVARCLLDEAIHPVVFERSANLGGVWKYQEEHPEDGIAYRSLRTNTSKQVMAFSDFPFPQTTADFPSREDVLQYLNRYADKFDLRKLIRFKTIVENVSPTSNSRWMVHSRSEAGLEQTETYDAVVVCAGFYHQPIVPRLPGIERFQGRVLHSRNYNGPAEFGGKRVIVVGAGSSGADIATEISAVAASVDLSARTGVWFLPHYIGKHPYDFQLTRLSTKLPYRFQIWAFRQLILQAYKHMGFTNELIESALHPPKFDVWRSRLTPGSHVLKQIFAGAVRVRPEILQIEADAVLFADGAIIPADTIVFCTGYALDFPFLEPACVKVSGDTIDLYKHVFSPQFPTLAFVGMCIVAGPVFPVAEMQARWMTQVFGGELHLPPTAEMAQAVEQHTDECRRRGVHPMRIQLVQYMDDIAGLLGIRPKATMPS